MFAARIFNNKILGAKNWNLFSKIVKLTKTINALYEHWELYSDANISNTYTSSSHLSCAPNLYVSTTREGQRTLNKSRLYSVHITQGLDIFCILCC